MSDLQTNSFRYSNSHSIDRKIKREREGGKKRCTEMMCSGFWLNSFLLKNKSNNYFLLRGELIPFYGFYFGRLPKCETKDTRLFVSIMLVCSFCAHY